MTEAKQPESLRLADRLQNAVATYPQVSEDEPGGYCQEVDQVMDEAAAELRRQHARIADLEAQLSAIGAGGVEPLRPRQCLHGISEPSGWMPIETAPRDGRTLLLGKFNSHGKWRTMRGQWMSENYIAEHWEDPDDVEPGWFETAVEPDDPPNCWPINPTHWMKLPESPYGKN